QDLSGYPARIGHRPLNLSPQIVSIATAYDALRSTRVYREGLPSDRIKSIMGKKDDPAFNQKLLRRFINLIGLFPIGTLVRRRAGGWGGRPHGPSARPVPSAGQADPRSGGPALRRAAAREYVGTGRPGRLHLGGRGSSGPRSGGDRSAAIHAVTA